MTKRCNPDELAYLELLGSRISRHALTTRDALADVLAPGYFDGVRGQLRRCDIVEVIAGIDGEAEYAKLAVGDVRDANTKPRVLVRVLTAYAVADVAKVAPGLAA